MSGRILVVDDEEQIRRALQRALAARGYEVEVAVDGEDALSTFGSFQPEIVVLDLNLPGIDGLQVTRRMRAWSSVPILVLSVREDEADKVAALDLGADDYLTKPFGVPELLARIRALLRRTEPVASPMRFVAGEVEIELDSRTVRRAGVPVHLTKTEWSLLEALAGRPGKLLTHGWLLATVWGDGYGSEVEILRVFVSQLRRKIEPDPAHPSVVLTEPGVGYRWGLVPTGSS